jgi:hypothetical protein
MDARASPHGVKTTPSPSATSRLGITEERQMMTAILPDTDLSIKTPEPSNEFGHDVVAEPASGGGAIVIRMGLEGICSVQIIADQSDEEETLLTAARPVFEFLQGIFTVEPLTSPRS